MISKIKKWYEGEFVEYENDPNSLAVMIGGYYKKHWTAEMTEGLVIFYLAHWKWLWGFAASVVGLYLAYLKL